MLTYTHMHTQSHTDAHTHSRRVGVCVLDSLLFLCLKKQVLMKMTLGGAQEAAPPYLDHVIRSLP